MKKILGIVVLGLLLSGNAYAGVNEPGSGPIVSITKAKSHYYENLAQVKKKNKHLIQYLSTSSDGGWASWSLHVKKIDEKSHVKAYKKCVKNSAKYNIQEDCFIFAIDDKIVWNLDGPGPTKPKKLESAESKAEKEKQAQLDKRPGRFFEDQPDVNDDYQVHFFYVLAKDSKDKEIDVNGWLEKRLTTANSKFEKWSKKNKKSNGVGQKFKFDYRKDGKIDITFVRIDLTKAELKTPKYPERLIYGLLSKDNYLNNTKKTYALFTGFNSKIGNSHGGSGSPPITTIFIPAVKSYGVKGMDIIILHELFHTQGASYPCGKRTYAGAHVKGSDVLGKNKTTTTIDGKNDTYYLHGVKDCPDLSKSVYLTPTAEDSWDPYSVYCLGKTGNFVKNIYQRMSGECHFFKPTQ